MKPGKEMDALVARKVMGWKLKETFNGGRAVEIWEGDPKARWGRIIQGFQPSQRIPDAWEIVEKLYSEKKWGINVRSDHVNKGWIIDSYKLDLKGQFEVFAKTAPMAICLAGLKIVGIENGK